LRPKAALCSYATFRISGHFQQEQTIAGFALQADLQQALGQLPRLHDLGLRCWPNLDVAEPKRSDLAKIVHVVGLPYVRQDSCLAPTLGNSCEECDFQDGGRKFNKELDATDEFPRGWIGTTHAGRRNAEFGLYVRIDL
jgi:hypothetical protein